MESGVFEFFIEVISQKYRVRQVGGWGGIRENRVIDIKTHTARRPR
jgi:hypothetical protein